VAASQQAVASPTTEESSTSAPELREQGEWPEKTSLYLLRTDGKSCSRELVTGSGKLHFAYPSTQQHLIVWKSRPETVMIIVKLGNELVNEFMEVVRFLGREGLKVVVEPHVFEQHVAGNHELLPYVYTFATSETSRLADCVDFVVCLGGDGVILHASGLFNHNIPPVIAFNLGSLGFLTNFSYNNFERDLGNVIRGSAKLDSCSFANENLDEPDSAQLGKMNGPDGAVQNGVMVTLRMRMECQVFRSNSEEPTEVQEVLNELVIDRGSSSFLTNIECYEKGRYITRVQADGIMLATPTGSTAYSVSAGGSMVHPNVPAMLLTPICPHSLSFRPIILPDYAEIELRIPTNARSPAWVCFDGRSRQELQAGDKVRVKMSENPMPTINRTDLTGDWFDSLDRCFRWSDRLEQKPAWSDEKPVGKDAFR